MPIARMARVLAPAGASRDVDVGLNLAQIRTGDPDKIRRALGFLSGLAPRAQAPRPVIEALVHHADQDIALRARDLLARMLG